MSKWVGLIALLMLGGALLQRAYVDPTEWKAALAAEPVTQYHATNNVLEVNGVHALEAYYEQLWTVKLSRSIVYYSTFGKYHLAYSPSFELRNMALKQADARVSVTLNPSPELNIAVESCSGEACDMEHVPATGLLPCDGNFRIEIWDAGYMSDYVVVDAENSPSRHFLHTEIDAAPATFLALVHVYAYALLCCISITFCQSFRSLVLLMSWAWLKYVTPVTEPLETQ